MGEGAFISLVFPPRQPGVSAHGAFPEAPEPQPGWDPMTGCESRPQNPRQTFQFLPGGVSPRLSHDPRMTRGDPWAEPRRCHPRDAPARGRGGPAPPPGAPGLSARPGAAGAGPGRSGGCGSPAGGQAWGRVPGNSFAAYIYVFVSKNTHIYICIYVCMYRECFLSFKAHCSLNLLVLKRITLWGQVIHDYLEIWINYFLILHFFLFIVIWEKRPE